MRIDPASPGRNDDANESSVISFDVDALAMAAESAIVPVHVHVFCYFKNLGRAPGNVRGKNLNFGREKEYEGKILQDFYEETVTHHPSKY
jgi:hypothetical protein